MDIHIFWKWFWNRQKLIIYFKESWSFGLNKQFFLRNSVFRKMIPKWDVIGGFRHEWLNQIMRPIAAKNILSLFCWSIFNWRTYLKEKCLWETIIPHFFNNVCQIPKLFKKVLYGRSRWNMPYPGMKELNPMNELNAQNHLTFWVISL